MSALALRQSDSPETPAMVIVALAKALGHPARIAILEMLARRDACVGCDIVEEIGLAQSTTSEHLRVLKAAGLVVGEIERPRVCYSINSEALAPLAAFIAQVSASSARTVETPA